MDIFIYASPGFGRPRDEIEEAIEDFLGDRGEVTGGGGGQTGSNVDIEVFDDRTDPAGILDGLRSILRGFGVPTDSTIVIDGTRHQVYT